MDFDIKNIFQMIRKKGHFEFMAPAARALLKFVIELEIRSRSMFVHKTSELFWNNWNWSLPALL